MNSELPMPTPLSVGRNVRRTRGASNPHPSAGCSTAPVAWTGSVIAQAIVNASSAAPLPHEGTRRNGEFGHRTAGPARCRACPGTRRHHAPGDVAAGVSAATRASRAQPDAPGSAGPRCGAWTGAAGGLTFAQASRSGGPAEPEHAQRLRFAPAERTLHRQHEGRKRAVQRGPAHGLPGCGSGDRRSEARRFMSWRAGKFRSAPLRVRKRVR